MAQPLITSKDNARVRQARALHIRRERALQAAYLVEGVTLLADALRAGAHPRAVFIDHERAFDDLAPLLASWQAVVFPVAPDVLRSLANTETPAGVVAVLSLPPPADLAALRRGHLLVVADGLADPGNLGSLLRAAEGAGAWGVVTTRGSVDLFNSKVVRAAMGAHQRLRLVADATWAGIVEAVGGRLPMVLAEASARLHYDAYDWTGGGVLVIGGERGGLSAAARAAATASVAIPLAAPVESLNAAVAGAVILFEAARQCRLAAQSR